jgi:putative hydrolase of HD superfamily
LEHKVDLGHTLEMILVHDLAEIEAGDHHAWKGKLVGKYEKEEAGLQKIVAKLPKKTAQKIVALWQEFEEAETFEAKFAQAMDKLEVVIQHNHADLETWNEKEHTFNIEYGGERMAFSEMLKAFREIAAEDSRQKLAKAGK